MRKTFLLLCWFLWAENSYAQQNMLDNSFGNNKGYTCTNLRKMDAGANIRLVKGNAVLATGIAFTEGTGNMLIAARCKPNGQPDTSYGTNGLLITGVRTRDDFVEAYWKYLCWSDIDAEGSVVLFNQGLPQDANALLLYRFNPAGQADNAFGQQGRTSVAIPDFILVARAIHLQTDSKILVSGLCFDKAGRGQGAFLLRLLPNGKSDPAFGNNGCMTWKNQYQLEAYSILQKDNGDIYLCGFATDTLARPARPMPAILAVNSRGGIRTAFGNQGFLSLNYSIEPPDYPLYQLDSSSGNIYVAGQSALDKRHLIRIQRFDNGGRPDLSFGGIMGLHIKNIDDISVAAMTISPFSELYISATTDKTEVTKFHTNGSMDISFGQGGRLHLALPALIMGTTLQPDGKLLFTGLTMNAKDDYDLIIGRIKPG